MITLVAFHPLVFLSLFFFFFDTMNFFMSLLANYIFYKLLICLLLIF